MNKLIEWPFYRTEFLASQGLSPTFVQRFWSKVLITDGCWLWTGLKNKDGYGRISIGGHGVRKISASRASWILRFGPIPEGEQVLHTCDNPPCVRWSHLWLGNHSANMRDRDLKGRGGQHLRLGTLNGRSKLTEVQVLEIRRLYSYGFTNLRLLAEPFGVTLQVVWAIVHRKKWNHI